MKPLWMTWRPKSWLPIASRLWRTSFTLLFAIWWGGLTFYAAIVVPVGTRHFGSLDQGFVTQQVTRWHNGLLLAMIAYLSIEAWRGCRALWACIVPLAIVGCLLLVKHSQLTRLMDFADHSVADNFYQHHAAYLWLTTVEWLLGLVIAVWMAKRSGS